MDFYLDRKKQAELRDKLATIPHLIEELAITITRQSRIQRPELGNPRRQKPGSRLPFHLTASEAADQLHTTLTTWVRHTCTQRQIHYNNSDDTLSLARWLRRNMIALALTEGSEEACEEISAHIDECHRIIDLPIDTRLLPCAKGCGWLRVSEAAATTTCPTCATSWKVKELMDHAIEEARLAIGTAAELERLTAQLIKPPINRKRITYLARIGMIARRPSMDGQDRYQLGEVLDAHASLIARKSS